MDSNRKRRDNRKESQWKGKASQEWKEQNNDLRKWKIKNVLIPQYNTPCQNETKKMRKKENLREWKNEEKRGRKTMGTEE